MPAPLESIKALKKNIENLTGIKKNAFRASEQKIQTDLSGKLRAVVVDRLSQKTGAVAQNFHDFYAPDPTDPIKAIRESQTANDYIQYMAKDKSWGGTTEAQVLGEALGVNIQVQPYDKLGKAIGTPYSAFDAGKNAPTIHLDNHDGKHWSAQGKQTIGDGNCLFNAAAQSLQQMIQPTLPPEKNIFQKASSFIKKQFTKQPNTPDNHIPHVETPPKAPVTQAPTTQSVQKAEQPRAAAPQQETASEKRERIQQALMGKTKEPTSHKTTTDTHNARTALENALDDLKDKKTPEHEEKERAPEEKSSPRPG
ncbi:MAG: hypothetical protein P1U39_08750 [Legionellaceae bacterium]|nr:hypothetical protein [Legionellaceae bacterium]